MPSSIAEVLARPRLIFVDGFRDQGKEKIVVERNDTPLFVESDSMSESPTILTFGDVIQGIHDLAFLRVLRGTREIIVVATVNCGSEPVCDSPDFQRMVFRLNPFGVQSSHRSPWRAGPGPG